ncbi:MAG TPA: hypothetical protein VHB02_17730 [Acidimicrobiales bacterium]|nr:hypothetical protein [Acidimicrobiales bacterium]
MRVDEHRPPIAIFDHLRLAEDDAEGWIGNLIERYRPGAEDRGPTLVGLWNGFAREPGRRDVIVHWSLPGLGAMWAARWKAHADPSVAASWRATGSKAFGRDRYVLPAVGRGPSGVVAWSDG